MPGSLCGSRERGRLRVNAVPAFWSRASRVPLGKPQPQGRCQPVTPSGPESPLTRPVSAPGNALGVGTLAPQGPKDPTLGGSRAQNPGGIPGLESRRGGPRALLVVPRSPSVSAPPGKEWERSQPARGLSQRCSAQPSPAPPCRGRGHRRSRPSASPPCRPTGASPGWEAQAGSPSAPARGQGRGWRTAAAAERLHSPLRRPAGRRRAHPRPSARAHAPRGPGGRCPGPVSARVRGAGPRPRSWKSGDAGWGCSSAGAGRDARAGGGAGWGRGCSAWGAVRGAVALMAGARGTACVEMHAAGAQAAPARCGWDAQGRRGRMRGAGQRAPSAEAGKCGPGWGCEGAARPTGRAGEEPRAAPWR